MSIFFFNKSQYIIWFTFSQFYSNIIFLNLNTSKTNIFIDL